VSIVGRAGSLTVVLGVALVVLGALGASLTHRAPSRPTLRRLLGLVPFGVLIGSGAALVRGWDLLASIVAGALLVPLVGVGGDVLAARRRARSGPRGPQDG
jgi:hypothetical protein